MARAITTIVLILILVGALGAYLGWFRVTTQDVQGEANINLTVDKEKVIEDKNAAAQEMHDLGERLKN